MYFGVQYYPEHWPEDRWRIDAEMMKRAGINTVRMGEFAWSAFEPAEGTYDFAWMERALDLLHSHGIRTVMCTMSRTPPPWVFRRYPGIVNVGLDGQRSLLGGRYTVGLGHPEFQQISQGIDEAVVSHFAGHPAIVGWQIDNEIGGGNDCYCQDCQSRFYAYLEEKYSSIDALNEAWGSNFWSFTLTDWSEVPVPTTNAQVMLEYRRFMSKTNIDFARRRYELIHRLDPDKWVTTNFQSMRAHHTDYHELAKTIDVNGMNHYPARSPEFILDLYRGSRGKVFVAEQYTRLVNVDAAEAWMRQWAWMAIAHGACGINFFRWRQARWGQEQFADGLLPHSGQENRRYRHLARMGDEIAKVGDLIDTTAPQSDVALLLSYETRWAFDHARLPDSMRALDDVVRYHAAMQRRNISIDVLNPAEDLAGHRLVIAPRLFVVNEAIADNLSTFVHGGGILCLTAATGVTDANGKSFDTSRPGLLTDLAGIVVTDLLPLDTPVALECDGIPGLDAAECTIMADEVEPTTAEVIATYAGGWRAGRPAITHRQVGQGHVFYVGTVLTGDALTALTTYLCELADVHPVLETPDGVMAYQRRSDTVSLLFLLNNTEETQHVTVGAGWTDALSGEPVQDLEISPVDTRVLQR